MSNQQDSVLSAVISKAREVGFYPETEKTRPVFDEDASKRAAEAAAEAAKRRYAADIEERQTAYDQKLEAQKPFADYAQAIVDFAKEGKATRDAVGKIRSAREKAFGTIKNENLEDLREKRDEAVKESDYETAAQLRDRAEVVKKMDFTAFEKGLVRAARSGASKTL